LGAGMRVASGKKKMGGITARSDREEERKELQKATKEKCRKKSKPGEHLPFKVKPVK